MEFTAFLSLPDAIRARRIFDRMRPHCIEPFVLTGGIAVELYSLRREYALETRPLNDIDLLVDSFSDIPRTLSAVLIFRHVHPHDPPARTLLQCVDPETAVRVDVFRACGNTIARAIPLQIEGADLRLISLHDLTAHTARLCLDLAQATPVHAKHTRDFLRLLPMVEIGGMEPVWQEHRKPNHPSSFAEAAQLLTDLIAKRKVMQIIPVYSRDLNGTCSRCHATEAFPLANAVEIHSLLGYC